MPCYTSTAPRRNAHKGGPDLHPIPTDVADKLSLGGRVVYRRSPSWSPETCNAVAVLAFGERAEV